PTPPGCNRARRRTRTGSVRTGSHSGRTRSRRAGRPAPNAASASATSANRKASPNVPSATRRTSVSRSCLAARWISLAASARARRTMRCKWSDRANLVLALRGGAQLIGNVTVNTPAQQYPGYPFLYIDSVDTQGVPAQGLDQDGNGVVAYKYARVVALYTYLGF